MSVESAKPGLGGMRPTKVAVYGSGVVLASASGRWPLTLSSS